MIDFIVVGEEDIFLSWEAIKDEWGADTIGYYGWDEIGTTVNMDYFRFEGDKLFMKDYKDISGNEIEPVYAPHYEACPTLSVGRVFIGEFYWDRTYDDKVGYAVCGERDDLMIIVNLFGELKGSSKLKEVIMACCEMTAL